MKLKIGVRFVKKKDNEKTLSDKEYTYLIDSKLCQKILKYLTDYSFTIVNEKGFNYHGNEVVITKLPTIAIDEEISNIELVEIKEMNLGERFPSCSFELKLSVLRNVSNRLIKIVVDQRDISSSRLPSRVLYVNCNEYVKYLRNYVTKTGRMVVCTNLNGEKFSFESNRIVSTSTIDAYSVGDIINREYCYDNLIVNCRTFEKEFFDSNKECKLKNEVIAIKKETAKGEKNMFDKMMKNFEFGVATDVMMSMYGPAFATEDGTYIAFDSGKKEYVDVCDFVFDMDNMPMAYKMPVATKDVKVNDYIRHKDSWVRVVEKKAKGQLVVEKIAEKEIVTIIPTKNMFGFDFYTKLICFGETMFKGSANENMPFGNILPFMMLSQSDFDGDMTPMMMMMAMGNGAFDFSKPEGMMMMMAMMGGEKSNMMMPMMMMNMMNNSACVEERDKVLTNDGSWEYADTCENE